MCFGYVAKDVSSA
jgi:hypothetical protein